MYGVERHVFVENRRMPGMNKTARQYRLIESFFEGLERDAGPDGPTAADALLLLDELRRLERKWREQVKAGSPRRIDADFRTLEGWYRRWLLGSRRVLLREPHDPLQRAIDEVEGSLRST